VIFESPGVRPRDYLTAAASEGYMRRLSDLSRRLNEHIVTVLGQRSSMISEDGVISMDGTRRPQARDILRWARSRGLADNLFPDPFALIVCMILSLVTRPKIDCDEAGKRWFCCATSGAYFNFDQSKSPLQLSIRWIDHSRPHNDGSTAVDLTRSNEHLILDWSDALCNLIRNMLELKVLLYRLQVDREFSSWRS